MHLHTCGIITSSSAATTAFVVVDDAACIEPNDPWRIDSVVPLLCPSFSPWTTISVKGWKIGWGPFVGGERDRDELAVLFWDTGGSRHGARCVKHQSDPVRPI